MLAGGITRRPPLSSSDGGASSIVSGDVVLSVAHRDAQRDKGSSRGDHRAVVQEDIRYEDVDELGYSRSKCSMLRLEIKEHRQ